MNSKYSEECTLFSSETCTRDNFRYYIRPKKMLNFHPAWHTQQKVNNSVVLTQMNNAVHISISKVLCVLENYAVEYFFSGTI